MVRELAQRAELPQEKTNQILGELQKLIVEKLELGEDVVFLDLGIFEVREYAAREGSNPRNGEKILIPAGRKVVFKGWKLLKELFKLKN